MISQSFCSTTLSKDIQFEARSKKEVDVNESSEKEDLDIFDAYNTNEESDKDLSDHDF